MIRRPAGGGGVGVATGHAAGPSESMRDCLGVAAFEATSWPGPYTDPAPPGVLAAQFRVLRVRPHRRAASSLPTAIAHRARSRGPKPTTPFRIPASLALRHGMGMVTIPWNGHPFRDEGQARLAS